MNTLRPYEITLDNYITARLDINNTTNAVRAVVNHLLAVHSSRNSTTTAARVRQIINTEMDATVSNLRRNYIMSLVATTLQEWHGLTLHRFEENGIVRFSVRKHRKNNLPGSLR